MKKRVKKYLKLAASILASALGIGLLVCYLVFGHPSFTGKLNNLVYDALLRITAQYPDNSNIVIVDMDEASLRKVGQLPWPRTILSDLVEMLLVQGVKAIGLDIWLTEPDRSSPIAVDGQLEKNFGLNLDFTKLPPAVLDNDRYFRNTISGKPVVLGAFASFDGEGDFSGFEPEPVQILEVGENGEKMPKDAIVEISGLVPPLPVLASVAPVGLLNVSVQADGIVREIPLLTRKGNDFYPALSLQTLMTAKGVDKLGLAASEDSGNTLYLDDMAIPINKDGSFKAVYYSPARTFPYFSAADVLDGKIGPDKLRDKIVFVGVSAHTLQNSRSTPLDPDVPEVEIHATVAENILSGHYIHPSAHDLFVQVCLIFITSLAGVLLYRFLTLPVYVPVTLTIIGLLVLVSWVCFLNGLFCSPAGAILALIIAGILILPFRYWHAQSEKRKMRKAFSQYVAPEVVSRIEAGGEELLKGQQKEVTVMFTDVRGFTSIAEKLSPQRLVRLLNCYFTPMTACVTSRQGTLDKFIGDALMAFWNAPLDVERHACQAILAAMDMQNALARLRPELKKEFDIDLQMGIGINTGLVHVGNMGSTDLLDYTCIGENVNLASRLEGMCKRYGVNTVVSASVKNSCDLPVTFLPLDKIRVKGSVKPQKIYAPLDDADAPDAQTMQKWQEALADYFNASFEQARIKFENLAKNPLLEKICHVFIGRCRDMEKHPDPGWDGVWTYNDK